MKELIEQVYIESAGNAAVLDASEVRHAIEETIRRLDQGEIRVAEPVGASAETGGSSNWVTHAWIKQAILLYFRLKKVVPISGGDLQFCDKIPFKKIEPSSGVRVVPPAVARVGSYLAKNVILMPSFVNIGAYVGEGTMVDTWATVGSCAQIGQHVHLSGGVGIGGVLEPPQAAPVIIEDHVFVGSRCIVVEGVHVEEGVVLGAGVVLTASTKIIDVRIPGRELKGRIPRNSVVIPGTVQKEFAGGTFGVPCALIIGERSASTDKKVSLNAALRDYDVAI